jgi:glycosyltransferase involved in cell wall biosynthesis
MKFGFYGNANNYPFMLARALRRQGHEILFLVASREPLSRPENRYDDIETPYPDWIVDVSRSHRWHALAPGSSRSHIVRLLNGCDIAVLNEEGPALARHLKVPHVSLLTGSDIEIFADPARAGSLRPYLLNHPVWLRRATARLFPSGLIKRRLTIPQRDGIRRSRLVVFLPLGISPNADRLIAEIGVRSERRLEVQFIDPELAPFHEPPRRARPKIFCGTRLTWKPDPGSDLSLLDFKGTDILVKGFADYVHETRKPVDLHLVRKGRNIVETAELARSLNVDRNIIWHEEMSQSAILSQFKDSDIVVEQLATSVIGMAGLDALAIGRPLIANGRPEIFSRIISSSSPICQAASPREVFKQLERLVPDAAERERVGLESRRYVEAHFSADAAARQLLFRLSSS